MRIAKGLKMFLRSDVEITINALTTYLIEIMHLKNLF